MILPMGSYAAGDMVVCHGGRVVCRAAVHGGSEGFGHVEVEEVLLVDEVAAEVEADVHAGLYLDAQPEAGIGHHSVNVQGRVSHEAASCPHRPSEASDDASQQVFAVRIKHLAVFCHDDMRAFVPVLAHVVTAQVIGRSRQRHPCDRHIAEDVPALCRPCQDLAAAYAHILTVVYLSPVKIGIAAEPLVVECPAHLDIDSLVGIRGDIAGIIVGYHPEARTDVGIAAGSTAILPECRVTCHPGRGVEHLVYREVYGRPDEEITVSDAEQELGIELQIAGREECGLLATCDMVVGLIAHAIVVVLIIFVAERAEYPETVATEEYLRPRPQGRTAGGHGYREWHDRPLELEVVLVGPECHECAAADQEPEVRRIAWPAEDAELEITRTPLVFPHTPLVLERQGVPRPGHSCIRHIRHTASGSDAVSHGRPHAACRSRQDDTKGYGQRHCPNNHTQSVHAAKKTIFHDMVSKKRQPLAVFLFFLSTAGTALLARASAPGGTARTRQARDKSVAAHLPLQAVCTKFARLKPKENMIRNLVFDFGGVVVDIYWEDAVKEFARLGLPNASQVIDRYKQNGLFLELEEGKINAETFIARFSQMVGRTLTHDEVEAAWLSFFKTVPDARLKMLEELHRKYRMYLLSNTNPFVMGWARSSRFTPSGKSLDYYFDKLFLSYQLGVTKPSPQIFRQMMADVQLSPEETLFIDDGKANTDTARSLGFATLTVNSGDEWTETIASVLR